MKTAWYVLGTLLTILCLLLISSLGIARMVRELFYFQLEVTVMILINWAYKSAAK